MLTTDTLTTTSQQWELRNKTWTGDGLDKSERGGFAMMMRRRRRTKGCHQCLESSLAASRAHHRHVVEEEEARKLVALEMALKQEDDAE